MCPSSTASHHEDDAGKLYSIDSAPGSPTWIWNLENLESLKAEVVAFEPTLGGSLDTARGKMDQQWEFLEKKIRQAAAKKSETAVRQLGKAAIDLYPNERLQERVFNIVPYLIKYGFAFLEKLDQAIDIDEHDHQVLFL